MFAWCISFCCASRKLQSCGFSKSLASHSALSIQNHPTMMATKVGGIYALLATDPHPLKSYRHAGGFPAGTRKAHDTADSTRGLVRESRAFRSPNLAGWHPGRIPRSGEWSVERLDSHLGQE